MVDMAKLERAFNPRTIAVVGDKKQTDYRWVRNMEAFSGKVFSVQIDPNEIPGILELGIPNYRSLTEIPDPVDYVVVAVPREVAPRIVADCIKKEVAAVTLFTSGFAETGTEVGIKLQEAIAQMARESGLNLIGPNCMGIYNPKLGVRNGGPEQYVGESGPVGFIAQSGTQAIGFGLLGYHNGVKASKVVSYGNGVIIDSTDYLEYFAADEETKIIGMYVEGVKDGRRFLEVLREVAQRKPVVIWKGGQTSGGGRAIASHTGSLAIPAAVWDALVQQCGAMAADNLEEVVDTIKTLLHVPPVAGSGVGLISISGGQSVAIADAFSRAGLEVVVLAPESYQRFESFFNIVGGSYRNPVDLGQNQPTGETLTRILEVLEADPGVHSLVVELLPGFRGRAALIDQQIQALAQFRRQTAKPLLVVVSTVLGRLDHELLQRAHEGLLGEGVATFSSFERAAWSLRRVADFYRNRAD